MRLASKKASERRQNDCRTLSFSLLEVTVDSGLKRFSSFLEVSSERREYVPIAWMEPPVIPSEKLVRVLLENATLSQYLALLTSAMHMAWMRACNGGRMKSDYRCTPSACRVQHLPNATREDARPVKAGTRWHKPVLDARAAHPDTTLADLYDPDLMPPDLRKAHQALDRAVDKLYRRNGFASERERVEHLFMLYEKMSAPLKAAMQTKPKRQRRRRKGTNVAQ